MSEILYVLSSFVDLLLTILYIALFVRVILSWLPLDEDGPIVSFVYALTEPVLLPVRALLERIPFFENSPVDFSTFFAMILLMILQMLLDIFG
ncbi:MAG: YggT family protein [Clostridia bacterium]|nr:YggT family protein [Clostridia bacterium]